jgi:anthranilate synthase component 1
MSFEFSLHDETHISKVDSDHNIPLLHLFIFRHVIVIDHFSSEGYLLENSISRIFQRKGITDLFRKNNVAELPFEIFGEERASYPDDEFEGLVKKGIEHCKRGDVFQLVLSNEFEQSFFGDDFQVYRQLRRLNPSPYLFYFDFESYRLFGYSPEAQLVIKKGKAEIHPIAGTVPKTGIIEEDSRQLEFLINDEKENAEHTMLVDLARNDLSRDCHNVRVENYKEVQDFSHVTHLVSKVTGALKSNNSFETLSHSFPAGTLSGTPKPKALELIHKYEANSRDFYGGAIGLIGANGDVNTAIVIRSFLSKNSVLHFRAGAGIVLDSDPIRETQEVHHKLRALRKAIQLTQEQFNPVKS